MSDPVIVSHAIEQGIDAIGMIFYEGSSRFVSEKVAKSIREVVPAFVSLVGVFVNEDANRVNAIADKIGLDIIQLHGDEGADYAKNIRYPYVRAIRAKNAGYVESELSLHSKARGFLVDAYNTEKYGGTGELISPEIIPKDVISSLIWAGGINPDNVDSVLQRKPYAIDVNSGVESSEAKKSPEMITTLIKAVRDFDIKLSD